MLPIELPYNFLLEVEYKHHFWEQYSSEGFNQILVAIFPDSVSFFNDAEKIIIDKKIENERKTCL